MSAPFSLQAWEQPGRSSRVALVLRPQVPAQHRLLDVWRGRIRGKLWVHAGWEGKPTHSLNNIWYSTDGTTWVRQTEHAPWAPRSPRTVVYKDKLWIFTGKHTGGKDNWGGDIWRMSLPK